MFENAAIASSVTPLCYSVSRPILRMPTSAATAAIVEMHGTFRIHPQYATPE